MREVRTKNAGRSRRPAVGSTGDDRVRTHRSMDKLHIQGFSGSRLGDRRDVGLGKKAFAELRNIVGEAEIFLFL